MRSSRRENVSMPTARTAIHGEAPAAELTLTSPHLTRPHRGIPSLPSLWGNYYDKRGRECPWEKETARSLLSNRAPTPHSVLSISLIPRVMHSVGIFVHLLCAVHCGRDGGGSNEAVRGKKISFLMTQPFYGRKGGNT